MLGPGGAEVLLYATLHGGLGALYPLFSREDAEFFAQLEAHMRQHAPPAAGRRHADFRSAFHPVRACVDGDLCEQFAALRPETQRRVAAEMVMSGAAAVRKRVEIVRSHVI